MLIIPRACARVCVGGRKEPPASRRLGRASPARVASPSREGPRCPRVPATGVTWSGARSNPVRLPPLPATPISESRSLLFLRPEQFQFRNRAISLFSPVARSCKDLCKESNGMVEFSGFFFPRFLSFSKNTFFNRRRIGQFQFGKEKFVVDRNEKVEFHDRQISSVETERKAGGSCRMEFGSDVGGKWFLVAVANGAALPYSSGSLNGPVLVRK